MGSLQSMLAAQYLDTLRDRSAAVLTSARTDLGAPVPSCPGWTVGDLVAHVGRTWSWAADIVASGLRADPPVVPDDRGTGLIDWVEDQARRVQEALGAADPESDCWTFGLPRTRLFWFRRQALETAVHAWDGQGAVGSSEPIRSELAGDGIDEFLAVMLPRQIQQHPGAWAGESLHLHRTDGEGEWMIRLGSGTDVSCERAHVKADVALRGTASSLYLWCVNRVPSAELDVIGDRTVADRWTSEIAF